ncbi:MAG: hypothetical protein ACYSXF_11070, partial [Planctomycetota bacterium]
MPVTAIYAAIIGILAVVLAARVVPLRRSRRVGLGDGGDKDLIPKVTDNDAFHGSGSGRPGRRGVQRDACIGQAPQRTRRPDTPHPKGRALLAASRVAHCLLYAHNGAARALLAA